MPGRIPFGMLEGGFGVALVEIVVVVMAMFEIMYAIFNCHLSSRFANNFKAHFFIKARGLIFERHNYHFIDH